MIVQLGKFKKHKLILENKLFPQSASDVALSTAYFRKQAARTVLYQCIV